MARILVYGDSNSWGYEPVKGTRFPTGTRWPTVMHAQLGSDWELIEEAMNGRTTAFEDPIEPFRNGATYLPPCLLSQNPIDVVIIALGVNDLKRRFSLSAYDIASGAGRLAGLVRTYATDPSGLPPHVILVAPAPLSRLSHLSDMFAGGTETSLDLKEKFEDKARELNVSCIAMGDSISYSDLDGIHLDAEGHQIWGQRMAVFVRSVMTQKMPPAIG
ncbi:SGNH/GDSL hydrolase family protein [Acidisoma silvae]|uniref:SGNH/GDSL hydrolase family protein n=1 Tax=Acidisoma silvae TaxID=2802396 RepID=A0A963YTX2_9PROT|nr:SGNH/GDSL hydrolase family protein [Acidisoma silvae]MCB8876934.1 SGNH/GDSL hydrolase family protein [Acidisoma silvae]